MLSMSIAKSIVGWVKCFTEILPFSFVSSNNKERSFRLRLLVVPENFVCKATFRNTFLSAVFGGSCFICLMNFRRLNSVTARSPEYVGLSLICCASMFAFTSRPSPFKRRLLTESVCLSRFIFALATSVRSTGELGISLPATVTFRFNGLTVISLLLPLMPISTEIFFSTLPSAP